jgi:hypothetical protein
MCVDSRTKSAALCAAILGGVLLMPSTGVAQSVSAVLSCPGDANPPDNPTNPQTHVFAFDRADQVDLGCRVYLSVSGAAAQDVQLRLSFPRTEHALTPDFLSDGDMLGADRETTLSWVHRASAQTLLGRGAGFSSFG